MTPLTHRIRWQWINTPPPHMSKSGYGLPMTHAQAVAGFRKLLREGDGIIYSVEPIHENINPKPEAHCGDLLHLQENENLSLF